MLAHENNQRDKEPHDSTYDEVYITQSREDGKSVEQRVDKVFILCYMVGEIAVSVYYVGQELFGVLKQTARERRRDCSQ